MSGRNLLEGQTCPVSQSIDAVKVLLTWKHRAVDPLPSVVAFARDGEEGRLMLILSNDKKNYFVTTARACSCPAASYHQGPCQHMKKFFGAELEQADRIPTDSIRPIPSLPGSMEKVIPSMLPDLHDSTDREAAYHSIKEDKAMWPQEA